VDNNRLFLYVALVLVLFLIWDAWQKDHRPVPQPTAQTAPAKDTEAAAPSAPAAPGGSTPSAAPASHAPAQTAELPSKTRIHVVTDLLDVDIDTYGGDLRKVGLRKYPATLKDKNVPFDLLSDDPANLYVAQSGLIGRGKDYPYHRTVYRASKTRYELANGQNQLNVDLSWRSPEGVSYVKRYVFHRNSYVVRVEYRVSNHSRKNWEGYFYGQLLRTAPEQHHGLFSLPIYIGGVIYTPEDQYEKISFADMKKHELRRDVTGGWAAMLQHYFVGSWMPESEKAKGQLYTNSAGENRFIIGYKYTTPLVLAPGKTGSTGMDLYTGPTEHARLAKLATGMDRTVDFGRLTFIASPLFQLLKFIHGLVGNWGWAIIALTVLIKAAFFPLNNAQFKSMAKMKKIAPRLKELKERLGGDKERYNREMMELYKREKINPMAGCLPIVIQIPVFIALYWVLLGSVEMRQAPFMFWIHDLSARDPYFVLPVLMGASMFFSMMMNPASDPMQRRIFMAMPIVFTGFFLFFPAGLVLYWLVNNLLQAGQQWLIMRSMDSGKT
jgi:YidC/Oxa1 family membrane protein insertase